MKVLTDTLQALLIIFLTSQASASTILEAPSAVCYIHYLMSNVEETSCSGVLVAGNIVVTEAHCFQIDSKKITSPIQINCGIKTESSQGEHFTFSENFTAAGVRLASDGRPESGIDFAFVHLNHYAKTVTPIEIQTSLERFHANFMIPNPTSSNSFEFNPTIDCRSSGFGFDSQKGKNYFITSDQSPRNGLKGFQSASNSQSGTLVTNSWGRDVATFRHGDSGGAFYCTNKRTGHWQLDGIISAGMEYSKGGSTGHKTNLFHRDLNNST